ncbi:cytidylyltransferase domain-containing protein [Aneurinibacillus danicus]|uniref:Acylneuraminate cytidylyltransferase n=1 Tax=Aneurinibacillus danicus TaxID=267746 RepID=A0A511VB83_9BACL|nr:glycosyltransferase family protein [Aneurinibacillus danicus]GEN36196.1 hypothetical protein ADA01nite_36560 [Aneurinibacillus danicus]
MKTLVIMQARMGSSRLPGKVLKPLGDTVVLDYDVSRCRQMNVDDVIVATSTLPQDDAIVRWCEENKVTYFRGSEDDVLSRYYECAKQYQPDYVIRVTSDCPFVDYHLANDIITAMQANPSDIVLVEGELPRGLVVEMISFAALEYIYHNGHEPRHREHVTYYAYEYPEQFKATYVKVPDAMRHPELRITLDTEEDYALCRAIANHFLGNKIVPAQEVVDYLLEHPEVAQLNAHIQQKPVV